MRRRLAKLAFGLLESSAHIAYTEIANYPREKARVSLDNQLTDKFMSFKLAFLSLFIDSEDYVSCIKTCSMGIEWMKMFIDALQASLVQEE